MLPEASVKAVNQNTNVETAVVTTSAGVFRMPALPPGTYRFTVSAPGFKTIIRENVNLSVAQTLTVDFALEVGNVTDQVTVTAETPLLETAHSPSRTRNAAETSEGFEWQPSNG